MRGGLKAVALSAIAALSILLTPTHAIATKEMVHNVDSPEAFAHAVKEINDDSLQATTIELDKDIQLTDAFVGIPGKQVTIRSSKGNAHLLSWPGNTDTVEFEGDVTFDHVRISPKTLYAQGHHLALEEGFGGGADGERRMIVYGGAKHDLTANTHLTIHDGVYKLIAGGNSAGTLTGNTTVEFGGDAKFPTAADGFDPDGGDANMPEDTEHYNLYFNSKMENVSSGPVQQLLTVEGYLPYGLYGGGVNGNVDGSTSIAMTGGEVYQVFGGGASRLAPSRAKGDLGLVARDTRISITGGTVKSVYGGGYNAIDALDENGEATANDRLARAAVSGDTFVTIAGTTHVPEARRVQWSTATGHDIPGVYGGSFHSSVRNTHVNIGGEAHLESLVGDGSGSVFDGGYGAAWGGGCNDAILGTTAIELDGNARVGNDRNPQFDIGASRGGMVTPLGRSNSTNCYLGGVSYAYGSEILNENGEPYAGTATVSGGRADVLMAAHKQTPTVDKPTKVNGSLRLVQTGGTLQAIEAGSKKQQNVQIEPSPGRPEVDIAISGGTVSSYIMGRFPSGSNIAHAELTFGACGGETSYLEVPNMLHLDKVTVGAGAHIAAKPEFVRGPIEKTPFTEVRDLDIEASGFLALRDNASIDGNLTLNGALHLVKKAGLIPAKTLTAAGTANGTGALRIITQPKSSLDYSQFKTPKSDEECVYATADGSSMELSLANPELELFVDRKHKTNAQDVWFISEQVPQDVTVTFDKNGGDTEADPNSLTVKSGEGVGRLPVEPAWANHTFLGWNTQTDGTGEAFTADTPVLSNITVYAQWKETPKQPWYYELYYQAYLPEGTQKDENGASFDWIRQTHGQGGWAYPNDHVAISHERFDGKHFAWDAIDGSGKEALGKHYVYDENFGPHRLSAACEEATKVNPLKIYYRATPHTLSYEYEGTVPEDAPQLPATVTSAYSASVKVTDAPSMKGWKFNGWKVKSPEGVSIADDGILTMPNADVVLVGSWTPLSTPIEPTTAVYKVEHYKQRLDGSYDLADADFPLYGKIGTQVTAAPKGYNGYHLNADRSELTGTVFKPYEQDGKPVYLVLRAYYDIDMVTPPIDPNPDPTPDPDPDPEPAPDPEPNPEPDPKPEPDPDPAPDPNPNPQPNPGPNTETKPPALPATGDLSIAATSSLVVLSAIILVIGALIHRHGRHNN